MILFDKIDLDDGAKARYTEDGYLVAQPRVARTGIQLYSGREVGKPEMRMVRVFRSEDEVFSNDSLHSYAHKPFTNDHPPEPVNADNWKKYSAGDMGDEVIRDGQFIRVPLVMMDAQAVKDYKDGKRELSLGYSCDLEWTAGTAPNGETYDAIQTNIRANHLALVKRARGGSDLHVGDGAHERQQETENMSDQNKVPLMVDGATLQVDAVSASVIDAYIKRLQKSVADAETSKVTIQANLDKALTDAATAATTTSKTIETKDAEITTLKKQVADSAITPAKLQQLAQDFANVVGKAKAVIGDKLVIDGKGEAEIMKQVVDAKLGDVAKDWNADQIKASFGTLTADVKSVQSGPAGTSINDVRHAFSRPHSAPNTDERTKAYGDNVKHLGDAWKGDKAASA